MRCFQCKKENYGLGLICHTCKRKNQEILRQLKRKTISWEEEKRIKMLATAQLRKRRKKAKRRGAL